jgi:non-specific serine/threonine protein kinase
MSPEQARGETLDLRSDLFSLGVVLYEMSTGVVPFPGSTVALIFDGILHSEVAPATTVNSRLPIAIENILSKALEKDKDLRYQTAAELRADQRLKRDLDSNRRDRRQIGFGEGERGGQRRGKKSVAVLYFENQGGGRTSISATV